MPFRIYQPQNNTSPKVYLYQPLGSTYLISTLEENNYELITSASLVGTPTILVPQYLNGVASPVQLSDTGDQITFIQKGTYKIDLSMQVTISTDVDTSAQVSFAFYNILGAEVINLGAGALLATYYENAHQLPIFTLSTSTIMTIDDNEYPLGLCYNINTLDYDLPTAVSFSALSMVIEKL